MKNPTRDRLGRIAWIPIALGAVVLAFCPPANATSKGSLPTVDATVARVPLHYFPTAVAASPTSDLAYAMFSDEAGSDNAKSGVEVVDLAAAKVIATIPIAGQPTDVAVSPDGTQLYVSRFCPTKAECSPSVVVFSTKLNRVVRTIDTGESSPRTVTISHNGQFAYVWEDGLTNGLKTIDLATGQVVSSGPSSQLIPESVALNSSGNTIYVLSGATDGSSSDVQSLDIFGLADSRRITSVSTSVPHPSGVDPCFLAPSRSGTQVYESICSSDPSLQRNPTDADLSLRVLSARTGSTESTVGTGPGWGLALNRDGKSLYSVADQARAIDVIDTATDKIIDRLAFPGNPRVALDQLAITSDGEFLFGTELISDNLDVIRVPSLLR